MTKNPNLHEVFVYILQRIIGVGSFVLYFPQLMIINAVTSTLGHTTGSKRLPGVRVNFFRKTVKLDVVS